MGYTLELGQWKAQPESEDARFVVAKVRPFVGGHITHADPLVLELSGDVAQAINDEGLVNASMAVTSNYSRRILEITGVPVSHIDGARAAEVAPYLMRLVSELGDEESDDYWEAADGNIKIVASTVLDWTFQHPDNEFIWIP
jgi:hypothetical protein